MYFNSFSKATSTVLFSFIYLFFCLFISWYDIFWMFFWIPSMSSFTKMMIGSNNFFVFESWKIEKWRITLSFYLCTAFLLVFFCSSSFLLVVNPRKKEILVILQFNFGMYAKENNKTSSSTPCGVLMLLHLYCFVLLFYSFVSVWEVVVLSS